MAPQLAVLVITLAATSLMAAGPQSRTAPDPMQLARQGWAATEEKRYGDALEAFTQASRLAPRDAEIWFGAGLAAAMLGRTSDALEWLERALKLEPRLTEASIVLGQVLYADGRLAEAIRAYEAALNHAPDEETLKQRLRTWRDESAAHSRFYQAQTAHFTILFEGAADDVLARRVVEMLEKAYYRVGATLSTYPSRTVTVVLYTREQFHDVTRSPSWAAGMYDGRIKIPTRGAFDDPQGLQRVLDHEFVHAVVATIAGPSVPTWLDEGLATALEPNGIAWAREQLARNSTRIPFSKLMTAFGRLSDAEAGAAYAQSAVAVQRMIDLRGASAVVALLQALGRGAAFETAFQQTIFMRYEDFVAMVARE